MSQAKPDNFNCTMCAMCSLAPSGTIARCYRDIDNPEVITNPDRTWCEDGYIGQRIDEVAE